MSRPVVDKAEVALEYPDKVYVGTFERTSRFDARFDAAGIALTLERPGDDDTRKSIHLHLHYGLFAAVLGELAAAAKTIDPDHRRELAVAVVALGRALQGP